MDGIGPISPCGMEYETECINTAPRSPQQILKISDRVGTWRLDGFSRSAAQALGTWLPYLQRMGSVDAAPRLSGIFPDHRPNW